MRSRGIVITLIVVVLALFAALNWAALTATQPLSLIFFTVQAPLGLVLLLLAALL